MAKAKAGIAWKLDMAAREFGCDPHALSKSLTAAGEKPDDAGCFTTLQICAVLYGDLTSEKIGLTRAQRIKEETANKERAGELIEVGDVVELAQRFCFAIRQKIILSSIPEVEKQAILLDIGRLEGADYTQIAKEEE